MPRGKIDPRLGGVGWVNRTPLSGIVWEMRRLAKRGIAPLGHEIMKKHSGTLRAAFRQYQIKHKGAVTATSRRRVRNLIAARADKVLQAPDSKNWRKSFLGALKCTLDKPFWRRSADGTVITMLEHADVREGTVQDLVGHERSTLTGSTYSGKSTFEMRRDALAKLAYPMRTAAQ
jgi:hypothetical protein